MLRLFWNKAQRRQELLSAYLDGQLSARKRAKVERLVATSEE